MKTFFLSLALLLPVFTRLQTQETNSAKFEVANKPKEQAENPFNRVGVIF